MIPNLVAYKVVYSYQDAILIQALQYTLEREKPSLPS